MTKPTKKTEQEIEAEWDSIAAIRSKQIESGLDVTYLHVLIPTILKLSEPANFQRVIDIGCGTGFLTAQLAQRSTELIGIELSSQNLLHARAKLKDFNNVELIRSSVEAYVSQQLKANFTLAIANMVLMNALNLEAFTNAVAQLVLPGGYFIFSITHPWFWSIYWNYAEADWFTYKSEIMIEEAFKISLDMSNEFLTTHVHRPLSQYVEALSTAGFLVDRIIEPIPEPSVQKLYEQEWRFPRYMMFRCIRVSI